MRVDVVVLIVFTVVLSSCCSPVDRRLVVRDWYSCLDSNPGRSWVDVCE